MRRMQCRRASVPTTLLAGAMTLSAISTSTRGQDCAELVDFGFEVQSSTETGAADCAIAVGDAGILVTTNDGLWLFDREGNELDDHTLHADFFGEFGAVDTVCVFDRLTNRFFLLALYVGDLRLAVSKTSTPDLNPANWHFYQWDPPTNDNADYPDLSVGESHVFASFALTGTPVGRAVIGFAPKAGLLDGEQTTAAWFEIDEDDTYVNGPIRAIAACHSYDEIAPRAYFMTELRLAEQQSDKVRLYAVNTSGTPSLAEFDLEVDPYWGAPEKVALPGNAEVTCFWNVSKRPVIRNGSAWAALTIGPDEPSQEPKTAKVRRMQIDLNGWPGSQNDPEVAQSGTINPGSGISAFYPTLHVDENENMAIAWNQCSGSAHVSIQRSIRKYYDDPGTLRTPLVLVQSESSPSGLGQWADYTEMDEDPEEPGVMWSHLMWFAGTETRKTRVARTDVSHSLPLSIALASTPLTRGTYVTLTVVGAGPGNQVRWYYSLAENCGSTYILPLNVTLNIENAVLIGTSTAEANGTATKSFTVPNDFPFGPARLQAAEYENTSEVLNVVVEEQ